MGSSVFLSKERTNSSPSALGARGARARLRPPSRPLVASEPHPHLSSATPGPLCLQSALCPLRAGLAPGHVMEPRGPVLGPQPHPLLRRALPQMKWGAGRNLPLPPPGGRDELRARPGFSISQQQDSWASRAAGLGRAPAGDPPSPARTPGSLGPGGQRVPWGARRASELGTEGPYLWEPDLCPTPTISDGSLASGTAPPFSWRLPSCSLCFRGLM